MSPFGAAHANLLAIEIQILTTRNRRHSNSRNPLPYSNDTCCRRMPSITESSAPTSLRESTTGRRSGRFAHTSLPRGAAEDEDVGLEADPKRCSIASQAVKDGLDPVEASQADNVSDVGSRVR